MQGCSSTGQARSCQADCELSCVAQCAGASLQPLWHQQSLLLSDAARPTTFLAGCPAPCRRLPEQALSKGETLIFFSSPSCGCSDLIPPLLWFLTAVPISLPFSVPASHSSRAQQIFHGVFAILQGMWGTDKYSKRSWENRQETRATPKAEKTTGGKSAEVWKGSCKRCGMHVFPEESLSDTSCN